MYNNMVEKLIKQKEEIENLIKNYQAPVNNFINTTQTPSKDLLEWRVLNENDEVDNLYVSNKTLFINDNMMVLKGVDGKLEKWEIKKIYPVDKKDEKITQLEEEIKGASSNPMNLMMSMLNPNQKQAANQFQNKSKQEQAEEIARVCNEKGISKEQLQAIINTLHK